LPWLTSSSGGAAVRHPGVAVDGRDGLPAAVVEDLPRPSVEELPLLLGEEVVRRAHRDALAQQVRRGERDAGQVLGEHLGRLPPAAQCAVVDAGERDATQPLPQQPRLRPADVGERAILVAVGRLGRGILLVHAVPHQVHHPTDHAPKLPTRVSGVWVARVRRLDTLCPAFR